MINVINTGALKSIPLSQFTAADFGYVGDVERLPVERAYREVGWYRRALDLRANGVIEMPYDLKRGETEVYDEKANSEDIPPVLNIFPLLGALTRDIDKYGAAYAVFETDIFGYKKQWRRLHPASIVPRYNESTGELLYFERMYGYGQKSSKYKFEIDELLWLWMPPDATENRPGAGVGFTALLTATAMANKDKFKAYYFERGAINPTIIKVKGFATQPPDEKERIKNTFQKLMGGIRNAFKITPIDGDIDVFNLMSNLKDMELEKMTQQEREDIAVTFGIPLSLIMSNAANYATARQDIINFYDTTVAPFYREVIAPQLNAKLFSQAGFNLLPVKSRLESFQRQESEKSYAMLPIYSAGIISANEFREEFNMDPLPADKWASQGQPSPQGGQPGIQKPPADSGIDMGDDMGDEAKANTPHPRPLSHKGRGESDATKYTPVIGNEAYVTIDLSLRPEVVAVQQMLRAALANVEGVNWQTPETFHITLVYCYDIDDRAYERTVIDGFEAFPIRVSGISLFNNPGNRAIVLQIDHYPDLDNLQKRVWVEFAQTNTSDYSVPQQWQPHCTMAYLPDGVDMPKIDFQPFELMVDCLAYMRDDYKVAYEVRPHPLTPSPVDGEGEQYPAVKDIEKWERMAVKRWDEDKRDKMLAFESAVIPSTLKAAIIGGLEVAATVDDVRLIFSDAVKYISH